MPFKIRFHFFFLKSLSRMVLPFWGASASIWNVLQLFKCMCYLILPQVTGLSQSRQPAAPHWSLVKAASCREKDMNLDLFNVRQHLFNNWFLLQHLIAFCVVYDLFISNNSVIRFTAFHWNFVHKRLCGCNLALVDPDYGKRFEHPLDLGHFYDLKPSLYSQ